MRPEGVGLDELLAVLAELRPYAHHLTGDVDQMNELLQDTAERALRYLGRFVPGTNLQAWVRTIMQRLVIDNWRKYV